MSNCVVLLHVFSNRCNLPTYLEKYASNISLKDSACIQNLNTEPFFCLDLDINTEKPATNGPRSTQPLVVHGIANTTRGCELQRLLKSCSWRRREMIIFSYGMFFFLTSAEIYAVVIVLDSVLKTHPQ